MKLENKKLSWAGGVVHFLLVLLGMLLLLIGIEMFTIALTTALDNIILIK
jgi:hypothetical protein